MRWSTKQLGLALVLALGLLMPIGCGSDNSEPQDGPTERTSRQKPAELWGKRFVSVAVSEGGEARPLVSGTRISISFAQREDRGLGWQAGCNSFGTKVRITGRRLVLDEEIVGTEIGCRDELLEQDAWLGDFLSSDPRWQLSGRRLTLVSGETTIDLESGGR